MARRKRKTSRRRSGGRAPRHVFHAIVRTLREITKPIRHRTGDRTVSGRVKANPWPKCPACRHRNPPEDYCGRCLCCSSCCQKCDRCGRCLLDCQGHDRPADSTGPDAH